MKKNLLCIWLVPLAILFSVNMHAQMTIGGKKEPEAFSVLELLNKGGLRLPQMSTAERDAFAVQGNDKGSGLTIYNKTTGCVEYWNKTRWVSLCDDTSVNALIAAENGLTAAGGKVQLGGALLKPTVLTTTAANTLTIQGLQTGAGTDNVLVADANGVLKWVTRAQFGGDNLGNHTATQDLVMSSKNITGAANITASGTVTGANITATTKTTTPAAQITTGAGAGKVAVSDASGNLTWTDPATIAAKGDNLGNHTATQNLEMSTKDVNNIATAYIKTGIDFSDRASATYPNKFILYKNNGALSIWNNLNSVNSISINETTNNAHFASTISFPTGDAPKILFLGANNLDASRIEHYSGYFLAMIAGTKTSPNSGQFSWSNYNAAGAQTELMRLNTAGSLGIGSTAPVSKLHVAGDMTLNKDFKVGGTATTAGNSGTDGQVLISKGSGAAPSWVDASTITAKGDNLGDHTATQALKMGANVINYNTADGIKEQFLGNADAARIEHTTGFVLGNVAGIKTNPNSGQFSWSNYGAGGTQTELMRIGVTGNLGIGSTAPVSKLHVAGDMTLNKDFKVGGTATTAGNSGTDGQVLISKGSGTAPNWVDASTITAKGDNLGNHTATQDLAMSSKNITGAANVTASGTVTGANITATTKTTTPAAQITTGAGAGKVAVSDASGNLTWTDPATIAAKGDNLGNHTATQDLVMSSKNITGAANITASGTVTGANITATTKTTTPAAQITTGAGAGKVAVSDASGNLTWTDPATIAAKGDNLGNHTATTSLNMASNDINNVKIANIKSDVIFSDRGNTSNPNTFGLYKSNGYFNLWNSLKSMNSISIDEATNNFNFTSTISFISNDAPKILFLGNNNLDASRIEHFTGYNLAMIAGTKTSPNTGQFSWLNYTGAGGTQTNELMRLSSTGNLGIGTAAPTNKLHVVATADPVKLEGLTTSTNSKDVSLVVDANGVVKKAQAAPAKNVVYTTLIIDPGTSQTINLTMSVDASQFIVKAWNGCYAAFSTFTSTENAMIFTGGNAAGTMYSVSGLNSAGNSLRLTAPTAPGNCAGESGANPFDFDIQKVGSVITITNRGPVARAYSLRQSEF